MKANQIYVCAAVRGLGRAFANKYNLSKYVDKSKPCVFFGLYKQPDYNVLNRHKGKAIVVFRGSDAMRINKSVARLLKSKATKLIAIGDYIAKDFDKFGLKYESLPLTATIPIVNPQPKGNKIYSYVKNNTNNFYNRELAMEISKRTGIEIILANGNSYSKTELNEVYKECFIGLRLTKHDGLPNTCLELGLMGRKSIYNGDIPDSIRWKSIDDICKNIIKEYEKRDNFEETVNTSTKVFEYLNINESWLNI